MAHKFRSRDQKNFLKLNFSVPAAILDLEQRLLLRVTWTHFAKIMQQMYNVGESCLDWNT